MRPPEAGYIIYGLSLDGYAIRYVGLTAKSAEHRLRGHQGCARSGINLPLYRWMRKYGPENVQTRVLGYTASIEDLYLAERWWIAELREAGYHLLNLTDGGDGVHGYIFTDEQRARLSAAHKGKRHSGSFAKSHAPWNKGRPPSEEQKAKLSAAMKGRVFSEEHKAKLRAASKWYSQT